MDVSKLVQIIEPIIKEVGSFVLSRFNTPLIIRKKAGGSLVTDVDIKTEELLISRLKSIIPGASFIGEESGASGTTSEYCWVIDPLDGTTNFIHGLPYFCISVALTHHDIPVWGAVYAPITDEFMYAFARGGAYVNNKPISVSSLIFNKDLTIISLCHAKEEPFIAPIEQIRNMLPKACAVRCLGATALDIAYVASGKINGIVAANFAWWDIAAGLLLMQEAGGTVTDFDGKQINKESLSLIGGHKELQHQVRLLMQ